MASVTDDSGSTSYRYDARGNIVRVETVIGAQTYVTEYGYDLADRMVSMVYPSGRIVDYTRDALGRVIDVSTRASLPATPVPLATGLTYEAFAGLDALAYGNGVTLALGHDLNGRMAAMDVTGIRGIIWRINRCYYSIGAITVRGYPCRGAGSALGQGPRAGGQRHRHFAGGPSG